MGEKSLFNGKTLNWTYSILGRGRLYIAVLTLVQAVNGSSGVFVALLMRNTIDEASAKNSAGFIFWLLCLLLLIALQICLRSVIRWLTELSRATVENTLKIRLTDTLLNRDYLHVNSIHSAEWMNRLTNDTAVVANNCVDIIPGLAEMIIKLVSAVIMILILEARFAAILFPAGILMIFFTWLFRRVLKQMHKEIQEADGRLRIFLQERITGLLIIRSFAAEKQTSLQAKEKMHEHKIYRMRRNRFSNLCNIGFSIAMNGMYLLCFGWCGYGILNGTVSFGTLTAVTQLVSQIQAPFANITGYLPKAYAMLASAERLMEAEKFEEEIIPLYTASAMHELYNYNFSSFGFRNLSFSYYPVVEHTEDLNKEKMSIVLNNLNLDIKKGEYVAFTGISGIGKSTALKLLMCVYKADSGLCYYRDVEGNEQELTAAFRRLFAYVPQGNDLMNGTIRETVSFAEPAATQDDERIVRALKIACADSFVEELENGIDTQLGEQGTGLSEGQMQRIAIARALFSDSPILLLDEATSSLDVETEKKLLNNLRCMTDKTVVIVTHRPAALNICDKVINFRENGVSEV